MKQVSMQEYLSCVRHFELSRTPAYGFLLSLLKNYVLTHFLHLSNLTLVTLL